VLEQIFEYRAGVQEVLTYSACVAALIWGGGPEKMVALVWLVLFKLVDGAYHLLFEQSYLLTDIDLFHAANDVAAAAAFIWIALNANRVYTLWMAAFQLVSVTAHLARDLADSVTPIAYAVMAIGPSWGMLIAMIAGLIGHWRRKKEHGDYRDWRWPLVPERDYPNPAARFFRI